MARGAGEGAGGGLGAGAQEEDVDEQLGVPVGDGGGAEGTAGSGGGPVAGGREGCGGVGSGGPAGVGGGAVVELRGELRSDGLEFGFEVARLLLGDEALVFGFPGLFGGEQDALLHHVTACLAFCHVLVEMCASHGARLSFVVVPVEDICGTIERMGGKLHLELLVRLMTFRVCGSRFEWIEVEEGYCWIHSLSTPRFATARLCPKTWPGGTCAQILDRVIVAVTATVDVISRSSTPSRSTTWLEWILVTVIVELGSHLIREGRLIAVLSSNLFHE